MTRRRRKRRRSSRFERIGNWLSLALVLGGIGAAGFVWWRWVDREARYGRLAEEVGPRYGVDPALVKAVMRRESKFDPWVYGSHGEIGLMQVTEGAGAAWARAVGRREYGRGWLWVPEVNVEAGSWYLARGLGRWREGLGMETRVALAVAEYNAGYGNVLRWLPRGGGAGGAGGVAGGSKTGGMVAAGGSGGVVGGSAVAGVGMVGGGGVRGGETFTAEEFVGGITYPGVRDYVREVMENWRVYEGRESGGERN